MNLEEKLEQIHNIIKEVGAEDPGVGNILLEGFGLSLNVLKAVADNQGKRETFEISEHLKMVTELLGIDLEDLVRFILETKIIPESRQMAGQQNQNQQFVSNKEADNELLDFITADSEEKVEAGEIFENLNFLNNIIDGVTGASQNDNRQPAGSIPEDPTLKVGPTGLPIVNGVDNSTITSVGKVHDPKTELNKTELDDYEKFLASVKEEKENK